ncbi:MAG TPA: MraY family glycosyltransferase [Acidimicrobiales bacterium]|nr:MraY family glycosyltransferase [Acidimicrobiales bacterium]
MKFSLVVMPDERRVHDRPTPTAGGAAMFLAFLAAMVVASQLKQFHAVFRQSSEPLGVVLGAAVIVAVGLVDDVREVSAPAKMSGQVLAGTILYFSGLTMLFFKVPFIGFIGLSPDLAPLMTVVWVVAMANAINFIDGLDGLAAGIVAIAAGGFFIYGHQLLKSGNITSQNSGPLVAVICLGLCLGFLPHNFHPARIFMGDAGAMLLGLLMAASTLSVVGQTDDPLSGRTYFTFAPIFIPFFILGIPMLDTAFAIVRRAGRRGSPARADKDHLHHRLMRLGHGQRRSVLILWLWTALLSGLVLYPTFTNSGNAVIPFAALVLGVALYTLFAPSGRRVLALSNGSQEASGPSGAVGPSDAGGPEGPGRGPGGGGGRGGGPGPGPSGDTGMAAIVPAGRPNGATTEKVAGGNGAPRPGVPVGRRRSV